jgi:hypothetical protein
MVNKRVWICARAYVLAVAALLVAGRAPAQEYFVPGIATPETDAGKTGLFVVPVDAPTKAPVFITKTPVVTLALPVQLAVTSGVLSEYTPYALVYLGKGSDDKYHIFKLPLTGATVPKPAQVSSLALSSADSLCGFHGAQTDFANPTTGFALLQLSSAKGTCSGPDFVYEVIHYGDTESTPPTKVDVSSSKLAAQLFSEIYDTESEPFPLEGMVVLSSGGDLLFYTSDTFKSPKTLLTGVESYFDLYKHQTLATGTDADFVEVTKAGGKQYLYRINTSGEASLEYSASGTLSAGVADKSNVYFIDNVVSGAKHTERFLQEPLGGGTVTELLALTLDLEQNAALVGSNGSLLVYATDNGAADTLSTLPVGVHSAGGHEIVSFTGNLTPSMHSPSGGDGDSDAVIFADVETRSAKGVVEYASESLLANGTKIQALKANSQFLELVGVKGGYIFQVQGITDSAGGYGGGKLYGVSIATGAATAYTTTGGGDFIVPETYSLDLVQLSLETGGGVMGSSKTGDDRRGLIYNSSTRVIAPITIADTNVATP